MKEKENKLVFKYKQVFKYSFHYILVDIKILFQFILKVILFLATTLLDSVHVTIWLTISVIQHPNYTDCQWREWVQHNQWYKARNTYQDLT